MERHSAISKIKKIIPKKKLLCPKKICPKNFLYFRMEYYLIYYHNSLLSLKICYTPQKTKDKDILKKFLIFFQKNYFYISG